MADQRLCVQSAVLDVPEHLRHLCAEANWIVDAHLFAVACVPIDDKLVRIVAREAQFAPWPERGQRQVKDLLVAGRVHRKFHGAESQLLNGFFDLTLRRGANGIEADGLRCVALPFRAVHPDDTEAIELAELAGQLTEHAQPEHPENQSRSDFHSRDAIHADRCQSRIGCGLERRRLRRELHHIGRLGDRLPGVAAASQMRDAPESAAIGENEIADLQVAHETSHLQHLADRLVSGHERTRHVSRPPARAVPFGAATDAADQRLDQHPRFCQFRQINRLQTRHMISPNNNRFCFHRVSFQAFVQSKTNEKLLFLSSRSAA